MLRLSLPVVRAVLLVAALGLAASHVRAQTDYLEVVDDHMALQFEVYGDIRLTSLDGSTLSIKKQTSPTRAWRLGLSLRADFNSEDGESFSSSNYASSDTDNDNFLIGMRLQKIFYAPAFHKSYAFLGLGPAGSYELRNRDRESESSGGAIATYDTDEDYWTAGLATSLGVEWFATRSISLLAEYSTDLSYFWRKRKETRYLGSPSDPTVYKSVVKGVRFGTSAVNLGLALYF